MKSPAKIIVSLLIGTLIAILSTCGVIYAGDWFLNAIGMSVSRAEEILFLFINACYGLMMALGFGVATYWFAPLCWKEHKKRKQEAEEERRAAEVKMTGGNEHEAEGED